MSQNSVNTDMPIQVAKGGTGAASHTAYSVLCGGTASTSDIQPIAGVGSAGQALTSNGAGVLPTFQSPSGGGNELGTGFNDDFLAATEYHTLSLMGENIDADESLAVTNLFYVFPIYVRADVTAATTALYVSTASASQKFRFAIFTDSSGDFGTRLFESGELDASTTGLKTYSSSVSYSAGPVWLVIAVKNTSALEFPSARYFWNRGLIVDGLLSVPSSCLAWAGTYGEIASDLTFSGKTITGFSFDKPITFITT